MNMLRKLSGWRLFGLTTAVLFVVVITAEEVIARGVIGGRP